MDLLPGCSVPAHPWGRFLFVLQPRGRSQRSSPRRSRLLQTGCPAYLLTTATPPAHGSAARFCLHPDRRVSRQFMAGILHDLEGIFVYMDDILLVTPDEGSHRQLRHKLFHSRRKQGLAVHPNKCLFGQFILTFLGHEVTSNCIFPLPDWVKAVWEFPRLQDRTSLQEFLGLLNQYYRFLSCAAHLLFPLNSTLRKHAGPFY